jgi:hydroxyacylglutathione hydrolase
MIFEQFYLGCLAHASYLIGSEGVAAVVDPQRDVEIYIEAAARLKVRIDYIIETHLHADFVSGHQELAQRTGAEIWLGEGSGATFPHHPAKEGDRIKLGKCRLRILQTPGHTPESISVVVTDVVRDPSPYAVLTGDTLFIGDVGRPDLSDTLTPQQLASSLYDSLHVKLMGLPDNVLVYPAHGAGSMCGRNISADRWSTIGRERSTNYALRPMTRDAFVDLMTHDLPPRPEYFKRDVDANRHGAPALDSLPPLEPLSPEIVRDRQAQGVTVLDTRAAMEFASGHIPGSIHIGMGGQFASWAGVVLGLDRDLILVAEAGKAAEEARMRLARVGIERVTGVVEDGIAGWARAGLPLAFTQQMSVQELSQAAATVIDVRRRAEWSEGHIPGAQLHPLDSLRESSNSLDKDATLAVHCKSGYRSAIACSVLEAQGFANVSNVMGGYDAWVGAGFPVAVE